ncbi:hypothetical protein LguiA_024797 [Lonicera macranthoides]
MGSWVWQMGLCMEEVDKTVKEFFAVFGKDKRKGVERNGVESKRLKIWMGKRRMNESDSDDTDEDDSDKEMGFRFITIDDGSEDLFVH